MTPVPANKTTENIILRMHPLQRILLGLSMSLITFFCIRNSHLSRPLIFTILWDAFAFSFITTSWIIFFKRTVSSIIKQANVDDGSRLFVMLSVLLSSLAGMLSIFLLMITKDPNSKREMLTVVLTITGMVFSWVMVHTLFTFHYAHLYYAERKDDTPDKEALDFPNQQTPDFLDFAYFSFVIGMTFQVSDVEINSSIIRRTALAHALLSFALNTFVVALTINLIAGLKQ